MVESNTDSNTTRHAAEATVRLHKTILLNKENIKQTLQENLMQRFCNISKKQIKTHESFKNKLQKESRNRMGGTDARHFSISLKTRTLSLTT